MSTFRSRLLVLSFFDFVLNLKLFKKSWLSVGFVWSVLILFIVVLSACRGYVVLLTDIPALSIYSVLAVILSCLSIYGFFRCWLMRLPRTLSFLRTLCTIHLLFGILWGIISFFMDSFFLAEWIWMYLAPFSFFVFLDIPESYVRFSLYLILLATGLFVIYEFLTTIKGPSGVAEIYRYQSKLRPDTFTNLSSTGIFYRAAGVAGNQHDSGNLLGLLFVYSFFRALQSHKIKEFSLAAIALAAFLFTQSAANIVMAILVVCLLTILFLSRQSFKKLVFSVGSVIVVGCILGFLFRDYLLIFTNRVGSKGDWSGMMRGLDPTSLILALPQFVFGFSEAIGSHIINVESAHLKIIFNRGFVPAFLYFGILTYPLYKMRPFVFYKAAPILFGFLSLIHYGSLIRSTNIFVFFLIYASCFTALYSNQNLAAYKNNE